MLGLFFLPEKYYADVHTIRAFYGVYDEIRDPIGETFANTAEFYSLFGLNYLQNSFIEGLFTYSLFAGCMTWIINKFKFMIDLKKFWIMFIWNIPAAIYLGQLTKEIIPILLLTVIIKILTTSMRGKSILIGALITAYAFLFRNYWFITLAWTLAIMSFIFIKSYSHKSNNKKVYFILRWAVLIISIISVFFTAQYQGFYITDIRTHVNMNRENALDAVTLTKNIIENTSFITDVANWLYIWTSLMVPVQFMLSQPFVLAAGVWNILNVRIFIHISRKLLNSTRSLSIQVFFPIAWMISFSLTQGLFEPDYGSFLRHQTILLPLYIFLVAQAEFERENLERM